MQLNKLFLACAMTLAVGQAFAHAPTFTPDLEVFISGSSTQQENIGKIVKGMMESGTIDVYYDTASNGNDYRAYFGTYYGGNGGFKRVLVHTRANGGSIMGVNPVARAQSISRMAINSNCVSTGKAYPAATYKCPNKVNAVPHIGVSDVEPALFVGSNLPIGETALNATEFGNLQAASQYAVVFGIAVSNNVPLTNLSRSQITSMLTGAYSNWSQVDATLSGPIVIERRVNGSGTQASANAFFGAYPCATTGALPLANASASVPGGYTVVENSSSGGVKSGLNADFTAGKFAIGLLSIENTPVSGIDHWHFVSIDGIAPTVANAIAGKYDYFVEQSFQYRNATVNGVAPVSSNWILADFVSNFIVRSGDPAVVSTLPGVAALPANYTPVLDASGNVTNGVMKGSKLTNTCSSTQLFY